MNATKNMSLKLKTNAFRLKAIFIFMGVWFGLIAGLNYLVLGKPTLWNDGRS